MWKSLLKRILLCWLICTSICSLSFAHAAWDGEMEWYTILPELTESELNDANEQIYKIWLIWWEVRDNYNDASENINVNEALATGIMNRDTLINYLSYVVKFLSQIWLAIWAVFIIIAGYKYMLSVFNWWKADSKIIKNAIIWVIIVIFSYAIMKFFTSIAIWS